MQLAFSVARAPENATAGSDGGFTLARFGALCILIALIPLQALSEELVFRGSLVQVVGQWTRSPWVAYVVPALLFVSVHNYGWGGQLDVLAFALCGAFLTWSTGGLEAALAVHAVANTLSFVTDPFHVKVAGLAEATVVDAVASISATVLATAAIWWLIARAGGIASKSRPR
ncbi:type II CAAX prenyl endopeptidase Rce1 family protein [Corynebacterium haemomassiliense]|uniref:CPBP family intramembrane metalloprotease n=1 Tax=Corynebacterium haemomassiliense TaxID=2754726 RepID=A0A7W2ECA3_9CORY|nr:CPBP family intramembrane metalloprotease [Corynebacterium haemomassiliense]